MAGTQAFPISEESQRAFIQYHRNAATLVERQWNLRNQLINVDLAYLREQDREKETVRADIANTYGHSSKIQNLTIPIVKPQVRAAVTYQAAVFLTDYPIFGVVSDPQFQDAAMQLQAVLEENSIRGSWARELLLFFTDGAKYNLSALEVTWDKCATAALDTDIEFSSTEAKPRTIIWQGNKITRLDPYNIYFDARVEPYLIPTQGEFVGYTRLMSRTALKAYINSLDIKIIGNIKAAFESPSLLNIGDSGTFGASYFLPKLNSKALIDVDSIESFDWMSWVSASPKGKNAGVNFRGLYEVSTEYVRVIPVDFGLKVPAPNTPQIWKLIIVNHSVVIYAERQTNAHEKIPILFGSPSEDGLGYQSKSLAIDATPFQQIGSALMNSVLASRRRAVTDRVLYDPSRISESQINSPNPSAKIPIRPSAYGKPVSDAVYQFPFRDDQAGITLQEIQAVVQFGNVLNGQNQARQGQFVKGNKTDSQWETTMMNATSADQMTALLYEAQVFTPLKEILKINTLQYQAPGTVYSPTQERNIEIDPLVLRKAVLNFKVTDGLVPKEKVISSDALKTALQVLGSSPQLSQQYNVAQVFSYLLKTENVNLAPFEKSAAQLTYENALAQWSQLAALAIQKGTTFNTPQPTPQQFGYNPESQNPTNAATSLQTTLSGQEIS
jgi:hypothetical protein